MNYYTDIEVNDDEIIKYVKDHYRPEDIFPEDELKEWALNNGFMEDSDV